MEPPVAEPEPRPPITRDSLLADLSRAARTCFPDRAEEIVRELERRLEARPSDPVLHMIGTERGFTWECPPGMPIRFPGDKMALLKITRGPDQTFLVEVRR